MNTALHGHYHVKSNSHIAIPSDTDEKLLNGLICLICNLSKASLLIPPRHFSKYLDQSISSLAFEQDLSLSRTFVEAKHKQKALTYLHRHTNIEDTQQ